MFQLNDLLLKKIRNYLFDRRSIAFARLKSRTFAAAYSLNLVISARIHSFATNFDTPNMPL